VDCPTTSSLCPERRDLEAFLELPLCDIDPDLDDQWDGRVRHLLAHEHAPGYDGGPAFNSVI